LIKVRTTTLNHNDEAVQVIIANLVLPAPPDAGRPGEQAMTVIRFAEYRPAVLIVHPYNDFMTEGGEFYEATRKTTDVLEALLLGCQLLTRGRRKLSVQEQARQPGLDGDRPVDDTYAGRSEGLPGADCQRTWTRTR
jgi:hypothetical protein